MDLSPEPRPKGRWAFYKKFYLHNFGARLEALWNVLTKPVFVVLTCKDDKSVACKYNVSARGYEAMHSLIMPNYKRKEESVYLIKQLDELLQEAKKEDDTGRT